MVTHLLWMRLNLATYARCDCPFKEGWHHVEVIYWPRTAYHWEGTGVDPNGPKLVCNEAMKEEKEYWDERWTEYWRGCL